ncbi:unnamed protein product [Pseudo-nitzschia multistriata]|uniref:Uncharacterized protein n=1 Tax=Pseudo-nitzschia multistriata TaxID=183589 RepID=A0A448ZD50_9STRA|nr:unnamed protein product [Pseudo-nitzschia multistriata]
MRVTTIRATTDIFHKSNSEQQLFPAAALRICDHHLHSSNIIPRVGCHPDDTGTSNNIYEHAWFCVSQAVQCYNAQTRTTPPLLNRVLNGDDECHCDVWVDKDSIGKSSIQFGGAISIGRDVLAVVRRVFVRMADPVGGAEEQELKSAPFSDTEKQAFVSRFGFEALDIGENYESSDAKKIKDLIEVKRPDLQSTRLKTIINGLEASPTPEEASKTRVVVGPQNINFGNHADHAFLAETSFHALSTSANFPGSYLSVQYLAEVYLGDVLESYAYGDNMRDDDAASVILVASRKTTGERKAVLIAEWN